jgi:hypothetical protein
MQKNVCTLFRMFGRKGSQPVSPYSPASRLSIAGLVILGVGGLLSNSAAAQDSPHTLTTPVLVKQPLSPEILAIHSRAKRPVAAAPTSLEGAATAALAPTTFNSDQGPGPGPIGPGPRVQFVSGPRLHRHLSPSIILWTAAIRHQSQLGRSCSIAGYRRG